MEMIYQGLKVQYIEQGQGPLVVLFHGWGANKELFGPPGNAHKFPQA